MTPTRRQFHSAPFHNRCWCASVRPGRFSVVSAETTIGLAGAGSRDSADSAESREPGKVETLKFPAAPRGVPRPIFRRGLGPLVIVSPWPCLQGRGSTQNVRVARHLGCELRFTSSF